MLHIHIISPSGHLDRDIIDEAVVCLRSWGYYVSVGSHAYVSYGRFAGTDCERLQDILEALARKDIDILLCSRGGYGLQRIIMQCEKIVRSHLRKGDKLPLLVGFSDITALHLLWSKYGYPSIHASMCKFLADKQKDDHISLLWQKAITLKTLQYSFSSHPLNRVGACSTTVIGGNLSVLYGLQATPFDLNHLINRTYKRTGVYPILLLEDICEKHYHIERMLLNFKYSGIFNKISGLIFGRFTDCTVDPSMNNPLLQTISDVVIDFPIPICFDAPIGHIDNNYPIIFGRPCFLSVTEEITSVLFG